ncbi:Inherit from virNOG: Magnesium-dependent phosphatase [Seminavis robusta]|uniref:Inherit from virNOG: Magnesium-dependent phosphatase n=1 Tax=Seminavis robusta TaxID=568900 RepID=A0A9N8EB37_9STRA|nr:Inherit from virNOG: Magnesium-dependent phosphatase [Seminavis robusta]|eukprot:Sro910_g219120.1 Inherit from virNOG: Magnesium-dependent phosphatase (252) ;mRNA; r:24523-25278
MSVSSLPPFLPTLLTSLLLLIGDVRSSCFTSLPQRYSCQQDIGKSTTGRIGSLAAKPWKKKRIPPDQVLPELIVLDLDNCLWTPELYQLNPKKIPQARRDIQLFPEVPLIFQSILELQQQNTDDPQPPSTQWAIASRAQNEEWALQLLKDFSISEDLSISDVVPPPNIQIQGGTKKRHFQSLRQSTGVPYHRMMFFDDWVVNLQEVSQLGVLGCHCPHGMTLDIFRHGLNEYHDLKKNQADGDNVWMGYII